MVATKWPVSKCLLNVNPIFVSNTSTKLVKTSLRLVLKLGLVRASHIPPLRTLLLRDHYVWSSHTYARHHCNAGVLFVYVIHILQHHHPLFFDTKENIRCSITNIQSDESLFWGVYKKRRYTLHFYNLQLQHLGLSSDP